jgi:hypothetical protein
VTMNPIRALLLSQICRSAVVHHPVFEVAPVNPGGKH